MGCRRGSGRGADRGSAPRYALTGSADSAHARPLAQTWPVEKRALMNELAILRRPQRKSDLDRAVLNNGLMGRVMVDKALIRRATTWSGQHVFLIPVERRTTVMTSRSPGLMIFGIGGGGCCSTAAAIRDTGTWMTFGPSPSELLFEVPDGVARLSVTLRTGPDHQTQPAVSGKVRDNVIALRLPFLAETVSGDPITWYGAGGQVIKHFVG